MGWFEPPHITKTKQQMSKSSVDRKGKAILDVTIIKLIRTFEFCLYKYIDDTMPKKYKYTLVQQLVESISSARKHCILSMTIAPKLYSEKYYHLTYCEGELRNAECLLNYLNDMNCIGDTAKARFDIMMVDIYDNLGRLLNSLSHKDAAGWSSEGTPTEEARR